MHIAAVYCWLLGAIVRIGELVSRKYAVRITDEAEGFIAVPTMEW